MCCRSACNTNVVVSLSFGGKLWPISTQDFILAQNGSGTGGESFCLGGIFVLNVVTKVGESADDLNPDWVVGDTFLVSNLSRLHSFVLIFFFLPRKMCILCSVPPHHL